MSLRFRPRLESLEGRSVPASLFSSALEWVPNPATDCPSRVMESQTEPQTPVMAVVWDMSSPPVAVSATEGPSDGFWNNFQAEQTGYVNEHVLLDWLFTDQGNTPA